MLVLTGRDGTEIVEAHHFASRQLQCGVSVLVTELSRSFPALHGSYLLHTHNQHY